MRITSASFEIAAGKRRKVTVVFREECGKRTVSVYSSWSDVVTTWGRKTGGQSRVLLPNKTNALRFAREYAKEQA